jgi:hypothetical protein
MDLYAPSNHQQANNINQEIDDYKLNEKDLFTPVSWDQAVELARKGEFVVASAYNSKGSGHITILDDDQSNVQSKDDIMLLNVGSVNGRLSLKSVWSASSREKVSFYVLNKEAVAK